MNILFKKFEPDNFKACYEVHNPQDGMRLDQFLQIFFPSFSREQIKEKIKEGDAYIEGRPGRNKPNTKVYNKEKVIAIVRKTIHEDEWWRGEKIIFETPEVIYEEEGAFVISKPPYMSTHPTGKHLFYCATVFCESLNNAGTHSIHRLDRETSGVLLIGRNPKMANLLTTQFENEEVRKCYFFIGIVNADFKGENEIYADENLDTGGEGLLRVIIGHHPKGSGIGKRAETKFKILHREDKYVIGLAFPKTGRQHQIRVHAMAHGFPLLGDKIYYATYPVFQRFKENTATDEDHDLLQISRHALHATALNLPWPGTNERKTFFSAPAKDLEKWIKESLKVDYQSLIESIKREIEIYFNNCDR